MILPQCDFFHPFDVDQGGKDEGAEKTKHKAEDDGGNDEARVGIVLLGQNAHAEEEEDDTVTGRGKGLNRVLDGGETLLADVLEGVVLGGDSVADDADDAGPVEELGPEEGRVGAGEDDKRLHNPNMFGEPADTADEEPVNETDESTTQSHREE